MLRTKLGLAWNAERQAFSQWRAGNFCLAASEFRTAEKTFAEAIDQAWEVGDSLWKALDEHLRSMPLGSYARLCELHHERVYVSTASSRTCGAVAPGHDDVVELDDACMICMDEIQGTCSRN